MLYMLINFNSPNTVYTLCVYVFNCNKHSKYGIALHRLWLSNIINTKRNSNERFDINTIINSINRL